MLTIGILLLFLSGYMTVNAVSLRFTQAEKCGLAFPLGTGLVTFIMLLADAVGIPLTASTMLAAALLCTLVPGAMLWKQRKEVGESLHPHIEWSHINLVWLLLLGMLAYVEYANFAKCMFFPTYDRDSMAAFDTIGYIIAQEHTLHGLSIFAGDYMSAMHGAGSTISYTPMVQLSYAYVYALGAETSKIIPGLMYLSFLLAFYALTARFTSRTAAMAGTLLMSLTPEMMAFSSLSATNVMHAVSASLGLLYVVGWLTQDNRRDLYIGSLLLAVNVWCRAEGVVFIGTALLLVALRTVRSRRYADLVPVALSLVPALVWSLFLKMHNLYAESILITHPFWDGAKAETIYNHAKDLLTNTVYYGWTFTGLLLAVVANAWYAVKKRDSLWLLAAFCLSLVGYFVVIYQIEYKWDSIENVLRYSAKRFLFCYVPIAWFYIVSNRTVRTACEAADRWLSK